MWLWIALWRRWGHYGLPYEEGCWGQPHPGSESTASNPSYRMQFAKLHVHSTEVVFKASLSKFGGMRPHDPHYRRVTRSSQHNWAAPSEHPSFLLGSSRECSWGHKMTRRALLGPDYPSGSSRQTSSMMGKWYHSLNNFYLIFIKGEVIGCWSLYMSWGKSVCLPDDLGPKTLLTCLLQHVNHCSRAKLSNPASLGSPGKSLPSWYSLPPEVGQSGHKIDYSVDFTHCRK